MKANTYKKIAAAIFSALLTIPTGVHADDATAGVKNTPAIIDQNATGSITLYKYMDNDGVSVDADGVPLATSQEGMLDAVRKKVGNDNIFPEKGVQFRAIKVADIEQVTETTTGGSVTGTYYTNLDQGFYDLLTKYIGGIAPSNETAKTDNGKAAVKKHYESDDLNSAILTMNRSAAPAGTAAGAAAVTGETALQRYARQSGTAQQFDLTNKNGYTTLTNLKLGLYLICETDYEHKTLSKYDNYWEVVDDKNADPITTNPQTGNGTENGGSGSDYADIVSPSSPFLISVPMTNTTPINGKATGTVWQYDITAYPKNGSLSIHKDIVTNDDTVHNQVAANDGQDTVNTETLCDYKQSNYTKDGTPTKVDGSEKSYLTHQIDANIGDIVTQLVSVDVPRLVDDIDDENNKDAKESGTNKPVDNRNNTTRKHNAKYVITDRMTKGLQLIDHSSFKVTLGTDIWSGSNAQLAEGTDYTLTFADDMKSFTLAMTKEGLKKLDDIPAASYLYVRYDCEVTKDALIGTDTYGNQRQVKKTTNTNKDTNFNGKNEGTTEKDLQSGDVYKGVNGGANGRDYVDTVKTETYDTTYNTGDHDQTPVTIKNSNAVNQNTAELTYATDRTQEHDYYSNTTKVYTYEMDLTKTFTDGTKGYVSKNDGSGKNGEGKSFDYSQVKFTMRGAVAKGSTDSNAAVKKVLPGTSMKMDGGDETHEQMLFVQLEDGYYQVWDKYTNSGSYDKSKDTYSFTNYNYDIDTLDSSRNMLGTNLNNEKANTTKDGKLITRFLTPNSTTGLLSIIGLDDRVYELTEVSTAPGRNLMAEKLYVEIVAPSNPTSGLRASEGKLENGQVAHAYAWTGKEDGRSEANEIKADSSTPRLAIGRVPLAVQNNEIIKVLKTGGKGTWIFFGCGALLIGVATVLFINNKRKEAKE